MLNHIKNLSITSGQEPLEAALSLDPGSVLINPTKPYPVPGTLTPAP